MVRNFLSHSSFEMMQFKKEKSHRTNKTCSLFFFPSSSSFHSTLRDLSKTYIAFRDFFLSFAYGTKLIKKEKTNVHNRLYSSRSVKVGVYIFTSTYFDQVYAFFKST